MLFPGAIIIIIAIIVVVAGSFSIFIGCLVGAITYRLSEEVIHKTSLYKKMVGGEKIKKKPWWITPRNWFFISMCSTAMITAYSIAGPAGAFIKWLQ